jgi:hypothetical protein
VGVLVDVGAEDDLGDAAAIAQVDEDAAAVIAAGRDPAHENDFVSDGGGAQLTARVRALEIDEEGRRHARDYNAHRHVGKVRAQSAADCTTSALSATRPESLTSVLK